MLYWTATDGREEKIWSNDSNQLKVTAMMLYSLIATQGIDGYMA